MRFPPFAAACAYVAVTTATAWLGASSARADERFDAYWNQGKAELTRYTLDQSRYGEQHAGDAVLIFVTEPFSRSKQVKLDDWAGAGADRVDVLKLNFSKTFLTGIYPYSLMLSVFTPVDATDAPRTLKTTMSGQEWCGHVFSQLNLQRNGRYRLRGFSYFESEGDEDRTLPSVFLEDGIWTRLRLDPAALPTGEFAVLPGAFASRLLHRAVSVRKAEGTLLDSQSIETTKTGTKRFGDTPLNAYRLTYLDGDRRVLTIYFEPEFPHAIAGWDETWTPARGGPTAVTRATRTASLLTPYWGQNGNADRALRSELDLPVDR